MRPEQIESEAQKLLQKLGVVKLPVALRRLAKKLGAMVRYEPYPEDEQGLSGILFREGDKTIIGVNALHAKTRRRFTIAHEIGHMVLHKQDALFVDGSFLVHKRDRKSSQATDLKEIQANQFAAALLMPQDLLEKRVKKEYLLSLKSVIELASEFGVSTEAMTFRLTNLDYQINQTG